MRIYKDRFYLMEQREYKVIGNVTADDNFDQYVTTGHAAQRDRTRVVSEYAQGRYDIFRLEDGHLPDYQPRTNEAEALEWLQDNPYQRITPV